MTPAPTILNQTPSLKEFPLQDILALASGLALPRADVHGLVAHVAGQPPHAATTALYGAEAFACVVEQLPFLKQVDYTPLRRAFVGGGRDLAGHLSLWLDAQVRRFGAAHDVMPRALWRQRRARHRL